MWSENKKPPDKRQSVGLECGFPQDAGACCEDHCVVGVARARHSQHGSCSALSALRPDAASFHHGCVQPPCEAPLVHMQCYPCLLFGISLLSGPTFEQTPQNLSDLLWPTCQMCAAQKKPQSNHALCNASLRHHVDRWHLLASALQSSPRHDCSNSHGKPSVERPTQPMLDAGLRSHNPCRAAAP
eukprot:CAMPEP_0172923044 /NCGR_PEP_ID=MMETSP1075-20121228/209012_1 /TAXON_ID=2916 /ORGANISM="Ceratium fusus, Strain PA161109" /LENGTH=184 /DNA_ID=CAMNT_0013783455 /DNA_START=244 /DNA_END=796 /DNA_ORIENTATION=-